jgi:hypothetical protein
MEDLKRRMKALESKIQILEGEVYDRTDPKVFVSKDRPASPPKPPRTKE